MAEPVAAFTFEAKARFADNLYRARERAELSQKEAAERAAITRPRLDKIEGGEAIPSFDVLIRLTRRHLLDVRGRSCRGRLLEAWLGRGLGAGGIQGL
jgi:transcriptional regulator with XRE-family HTH domain